MGLSLRLFRFKCLLGPCTNYAESPRCHKAYLLLLGLLLCASHLFSQPYLFDARRITTENGLANLMATTIYQDQQGFIWIGTGYGLNRYDGHSFKLYTKEKQALYANQDIRRISEDKEQNKWLFYKKGRTVVPDTATVQAVDIFNPQTEQTLPFDVYFSGKAPFKAIDITLPNIIDPKRRQWISTNKGALFLYDGSFKKVFQQEGALFQYLALDAADNIWAAWGNRLLCIHPSGKVLESSVLPGQVAGMYTGTDQTLWLSLINRKKMGIWQRTKDGRLNPFLLVRDGHPLALSPPNNFFAHRDQKGYWYVAVDRQINLFAPEGNWLFNYHTLIGKDFNTPFMSCFEAGNYVWLATPTGVIQAGVAKNRFELVHQKEKGYSDCRGITEDEAGNIYFLNTQLFKWDTKTRTCQKLSNTEGAFGLIYADSAVWAGDYTTKSLGFEFNLSTQKEVRYPVLDPSAHVAYALVKTNKPGWLLAGQNKGLAYIDLKTKQLVPFNQYNGFEVLKNSEIHDFHKNANGIWLATDHGVFLMDEARGIVRHYDIVTGDLPFDHIRHIHEDKNGVFWLATKGGGIVQWHPSLDARKKSESRQFTTAQGLSDNYTYAVYGDDFGKLWIPSDKGLMWMDKTSFRVRTFLREDGLPHIEFNHTAHYQAKDGILYFGGLGGLIAVNPKDFATELANETPLEFTGYYLQEGGAEAMTDKSKLLQTSDVLTIQPSDKFFELHFTLLDFAASERHRYAYQIEGYSDNWNYTKANFIRITHLPYGNYTLKIKGQHVSGGWSEQELSLIIKVLKPFYLQWWFILTAFVGMGCMVLASVRWRVKKLEKDRAELEVEVQKRTWQIEEDKQIITAQAEALQKLDQAKTRFFSNITHEFRTPLTLIIGPLEQLIATEAAVLPIRKHLSGVLKNARQLLVLINQLLDLSKLEGRQMRVETVYGDIVGYTRDLIGQFKPLADKKQQQLSFVPAQKKWETHFDKNAWDKILYNLLYNAIKFTPKGGAVTLSIEQQYGETNGIVHLMVTDTGIGIQTDALEHIFDRFYQVDNSLTRAQGGTGIGLSLVKELVELQGGDIQVSSEFGTGTSFNIWLPVLRAVVAPLTPAPLAPSDALFPVSAEEDAPALNHALAVVQKEKMKLLLIEDNEAMRTYIRGCLDASVYHILEAADGEEGIQKAQEFIPDLIVSDVMMPQKNGFEVVQAIRGNLCTSHIPLILLTAKASLESRLEGLARGADAYLTKPFSPQDLALRIQNLIALRQLLRSRYQNGTAPEASLIFQKEDAFIIELRAYIEANLGEPDLNIENLSRHFGISRTQLYRKLDALIAKPIGDYIRSIRLETAEQLLKEHRLTIAEVAYSTGFSSPSHFSRSYKKAYGKAPSAVQ